LKILISIKNQTLDVLSQANTLATYPVSTARNGVNNEKNSGGTPIGKHIVRAKIGEGHCLNSVFVGRRFTGEIYETHLAETSPDRDWILTRILWLSGVEKGLNRLGNVDTMQRYIYIHGTPDSEPMGVPLSHGCIRMRNQDILALFNQVPVSTAVEIVA